MCGFFASNDPRVQQKDLDQIIKRVGFRGPDGHSELVLCGEWKLFHARLSIIAPREEFSQPYISENGSTIIFNGEILNFRELVEKYQLPSTDSDTAALNTLLDVGDFNLNEIEGFFAFLRIDKSGKLTHCARDRFGVKPLFMHEAGQYLTVSSEASIISDLYELAHSKEAVEEYHVFRAPVFSGSYFNEISSVTPGTCTETGTFFDPLSHIEKKYWEKPAVMAELETTISASISSRLVSDVPVGLLYSGGIDSNLLSTISDAPLIRFTGGFSGDYDFEFAKNLQPPTEDRETVLIEVSDDNFRQRFREMVSLRKEPLSVPNEVILSFLAEEWAKRGGKVLISGEAADEFFAGYDRIFGWAANATEFDVKKFIDLYCYVPRDSISDQLVEKMENFFSPISHLGPFEMVRYFFIKKHLPVLFRRLDFALMFAGIEGREPLASYEVFKLALRCAPEDLFRGPLGKLPLRLLAEERLGSEFAFASKVGFPVDLGRVFRGVPARDKYENYSIWCDENMGEFQ